MRSKEEIKQELHIMNEAIIKAKADFNKLSDELKEYQTDFLKPLIGHCYKNEYCCFVITNTPQPTFLKIGTHTNFYQIPVYIIHTKGENFGVFEYDTTFSKAVDADDPLKWFAENHEEISVKEFFSIANQVINQVISGVKGDTNA